MSRLVLAGVLAAASFGLAVPAQAGLSGPCDGVVDVACSQGPACPPDYPCTITPSICVLWVQTKCVVKV